MVPLDRYCAHHDASFRSCRSQARKLSHIPRSIRVHRDSRPFGSATFTGQPTKAPRSARGPLEAPVLPWVLAGVSDANAVACGVGPPYRDKSWDTTNPQGSLDALPIKLLFRGIFAGGDVPAEGSTKDVIRPHRDAPPGCRIPVKSMPGTDSSPVKHLTITLRGQWIPGCGSARPRRSLTAPSRAWFSKHCGATKLPRRSWRSTADDRRDHGRWRHPCSGLEDPWEPRFSWRAEGPSRRSSQAHWPLRELSPSRDLRCSRSSCRRRNRTRA
jgi:hypothetical protein